MKKMLNFFLYYVLRPNFDQRQARSNKLASINRISLLWKPKPRKPRRSLSHDLLFSLIKITVLSYYPISFSIFRFMFTHLFLRFIYSHPVITVINEQTSKYTILSRICILFNVVTRLVSSQFREPCSQSVT